MKGKSKVNASMPKHPYMEETDAADETNMAKTQLKAIGAKSSNLASMMKNPKNLPAWVQSKLSVAKDSITSVDDYMTHSDKKLDEKAPPGAKYERMVRHIKDRLGADGLTKKEKGIAFATAWKAKNREKLKEKVEFDPSTETPRNMEEAMGSVKKASPLKRFKTKAKTVVRRGLGKERETQTILVTNKGDPSAATGGGVHRIPKSKYDPSKHNMASE
jgi:hypothetical protein